MLHDPLPTRRDGLSEGEHYLVQVLKRRPSVTEFEIKAAGILRSKFRSVRRPWLRLSETDVTKCDCASSDCEECLGFNEVHGRDSNGRPLPVRRVSYPVVIPLG